MRHVQEMSMQGGPGARGSRQPVSAIESCACCGRRKIFGPEDRASLPNLMAAIEISGNKRAQVSASLNTTRFTDTHTYIDTYIYIIYDMRNINAKLCKDTNTS